MTVEIIPETIDGEIRKLAEQFAAAGMGDVAVIEQDIRRLVFPPKPIDVGPLAEMKAAVGAGVKFTKHELNRKQRRAQKSRRRFQP